MSQVRSLSNRVAPESQLSQRLAKAAQPMCGNRIVFRAAEEDAPSLARFFLDQTGRNHGVPIPSCPLCGNSPPENSCSTAHPLDALVGCFIRRLPFTVMRRSPR